MFPRPTSSDWRLTNYYYHYGSPIQVADALGLLALPHLCGAFCNLLHVIERMWMDFLLLVFIVNGPGQTPDWYERNIRTCNWQWNISEVLVTWALHKARKVNA